nr:isoform 2 of auxin response factor 23 [Quercus suber]
MSHVSTHSYKKVTSILDTIAKVKLCLVMMDLECDALVVEMFQSFLKMIRYMGTIVGNKDIDCIRWPGSEWRCLEECRASESRDENEALLAPPTGCYRYRLFGVNLFNSFLELPSPQVATYCELSSPCSVPPTSQSSVCQTIQVRKYGNALGRSVGLMRFDGYDEMISELDHMFDFKGSLINGSSGWHVTFTDDEGDMFVIVVVLIQRN